MSPKTLCFEWHNITCGLFDFRGHAAPKPKSYEYLVLAVSPSPFTLNGKQIKKGDKIQGKTILALNNTQAIRLKQIRNDGKRVVFTVGPKNVKRNETINALYNKKFTSSKDKPVDWVASFNDYHYLIDTLSFNVSVSNNSFFEMIPIHNPSDTIKVYPHDDELILTQSMFDRINHSDEEHFRVFVRRNDEKLSIADDMIIVFMPFNQ